MGERGVTSSGRTVLLVEPDAAIREEVANYLGHEHGLSITSTGTIRVADAAIKADAAAFDAVVLSLGTPDGDACDLCARLRRESHATIVVIMTGPNTEAEIVRGLDAGANDYIIQPFRLSELLARLRAHWRMNGEHGNAVFSLGPYRFRPPAKALYDTDRSIRIPLTGLEVSILKFLFMSGGRPVDRQELLREVWGYSGKVATHTVETHMHRLRRKIEIHPKLPNLLLSDRDGYRVNLVARAAGRTEPQAGP
jgi:DNA-binding response OmpR family regulator